MIHKISVDIIRGHIYPYLILDELNILDTSICNHQLRSRFVEALNGMEYSFACQPYSRLKLRKDNIALKHQKVLKGSIDKSRLVSVKKLSWIVRRGLIIEDLVVGPQLNSVVGDFLGRSRKSKSVCLYGNFVGGDYNRKSEDLFSSKLLYHFDCTETTNMDDNKIKTILTGCTNLNTLVLSTCNRITNTVLMSIFSENNHLREVDLSGCLKLDDICIVNLSHSCKNIMSINLSWLRITETSLQSIFTNCPVIQTIVLNGCQLIRNITIWDLCDSWKQLKYIDISSSSISLEPVFVSPQTSPLGLAYPNIERLQLNERNWNSDHESELLLTLQKFPNLRELGLSTNLHIHPLIGFISLQYPQLQSLNIASSYLDDSALLELSSRCRHISALDISFSHQLTDLSLIALAYNCSNLQKVNLNSCVLLTDQSIAVLLERCRQLTVLTLAHCDNITDATLLAIAAHNHSTIEYLDVEDCERISDEGVCAIVIACQRLLYLNLNCCPISDIAVETIAQHSNSLLHLDVGECQITNKALAAIERGCKRLTKLFITKYNYWCLDGNGDVDEVTDFAVNGFRRKRPDVDVHLSSVLIK